MARTKVITTNNENGPASVEIFYTTLTPKELEQAVKNFESQLKEGGTNECI